MCGSSLNVKVNPFVFLVDTSNKLLENETLKWKSKFFQLANLRPKNKNFGSEKLQIGFKDYVAVVVLVVVEELVCSSRLTRWKRK